MVVEFVSSQSAKHPDREIDEGNVRQYLEEGKGTFEPS
jgi:hypothetical protein